MKYQKIYISLVLSAGSKNRNKLSKDNLNYIYFENHHILPKCLGGLNIPSNLVLLTAREHFIAHKLLTKIYPKNYRINKALFCMLSAGKSNRVTNSNEFARARESISVVPENVIQNMRKASQKAMNSRTAKEIHNWHSHPHTTESKAKISATSKGRIPNVNTRFKMSNAQKERFSSMSKEEKQKEYKSRCIVRNIYDSNNNLVESSQTNGYNLCKSKGYPRELLKATKEKQYCSKISKWNSFDGWYIITT